jgi:outer membrane lipoprotein carrier protein
MYVKLSALALIAAAGTLPLCAAADVPSLLRKVEARYNTPRTMQMSFEMSMSGQARINRTESGTLYLQKPGRMRWDYRVPEGKVFLADGKYIWLYSPSAGRVERSPMKESDDMRAPLAFLMGRLDFDRDFKEFRTRPEGEDLYVAATPKSDRAPYSMVEFLLTPDGRIRMLKVTQDNAVMTFLLSEEKANPKLDPALFRFQAPPGVEVVAQ